MKCKHNTLTLPCNRAIHSRYFGCPLVRSLARCWVSLAKKKRWFKLSESLILSENVLRMHFVIASDVQRALVKRVRFVSNWNSQLNECECGRVTKKMTRCELPNKHMIVRCALNEWIIVSFCFSFLHSWPCAFAITSVWIYTRMLRHTCEWIYSKCWAVKWGDDDGGGGGDGCEKTT